MASPSTQNLTLSSYLFGSYGDHVNPLPEICGTKELSERWNISTAAVSELTRKPGFPAGRRIRSGPVWAMADIESWERDLAAAGLPRPGERPRGPEPAGGR